MDEERCFYNSRLLNSLKHKKRDDKMRCNKCKVEMEFKTFEEDGKVVSGHVCPECGVTVYSTDDASLYRKMGVIE